MMLYRRPAKISAHYVLAKRALDTKVQNFTELFPVLCAKAAILRRATELGENRSTVKNSTTRILS